MSCYQNIIVAIDLSSENQTILSRSLKLCNNEPARLHLIHVCEHPITGYGEQTGKNHCVTETQIRQRVYPELKSLSEQHLIPNQNIHIQFGDPADTLHNFAESINADLIICGSHGKKGLMLLLGSTANSIVHGAKCDVLTIRV